MAESGLNAESPPLGLNVVSHHNVEAGSKNRQARINLLQSLVLCRGEEKGLFDFWNGVLICLFGVCNLGQARLSGV